MVRFNRAMLALLPLSLITLCGCQDLVPRDTSSLFLPTLQRSEIFGFVAGLGTTFAAVPDLLAMLKRRSSIGMHPRMAAITGVFQILWVYYGLLIASRPVIAWNIAVLINFSSVGAYRHFIRIEKPSKKASIRFCWGRCRPLMGPRNFKLMEITYA
jgi:MtN3 and saliva related transmembrane protein